MMHDLFGSFGSGAIGRVRFIVLSLVLALIAIGFAVSLGVGAGIFDRTTGTTGGTPLLSGIGPVSFMVVMAACAVGSLNIVAKRARDIGWNPLLLVILYIIGLGVVWVVLAVCPGAHSRGEAAVA